MGGGHAGSKLGGSICEARIDNVARSSDWIRLCYQNQQPGDSLVIMNTFTVPVLVSPTNGTTGLSGAADAYLERLSRGRSTP